VRELSRGDRGGPRHVAASRRRVQRSGMMREPKWGGA
jgi:hypothetical protein